MSLSSESCIELALCGHFLTLNKQQYSVLFPIVLSEIVAVVYKYVSCVTNVKCQDGIVSHQ